MRTRPSFDYARPTLGRHRLNSDHCDRRLAKVGQNLADVGSVSANAWAISAKVRSTATKLLHRSRPPLSRGFTCGALLLTCFPEDEAAATKHMCRSSARGRAGDARLQVIGLGGISGISKDICTLTAKINSALAARAARCSPVRQILGCSQQVGSHARAAFPTSA